MREELFSTTIFLRGISDISPIAFEDFLKKYSFLTLSQKVFI
jgi:acid phosphatase class B